MARWGVSNTLRHTGAAPSPSARCCGSVSSNRNPSRVNGELERLGMRAERQSWRLIVDKIRDQRAPVRDMLEEVWRLGLCRALWCSQTRCPPFIRSRLFLQAGNWSLKMLGKFPGLEVRGWGAQRGWAMGLGREDG